MKPAPSSPLASEAELERLDAALTRLRRLWQRPAVRAWYRQRLDLAHTDGTLYRTLRAIERTSADEVCVGDVAAVLEVSPSTASRLVEAAVGSGLVERIASSVDGRRTCLELSPAGRDRLDRLREVRLALLHALTEDWDPADIAVLGDLLDRLDTAVERLDEGPA